MQKTKKRKKKTDRRKPLQNEKRKTKNIRKAK